MLFNLREGGNYLQRQTAGSPKRAVLKARLHGHRRVGLPVRLPGLLRRQGRDSLPRSADARCQRSRIIVPRGGPVALQSDGAETRQGGWIVGVAEGHERAGIPAFGRALQEGASGGDVALGEGDEPLGAEAPRVVYGNRERGDGCRVRRRPAKGGREPVDHILRDRVGGRRRLLPWGGRLSDENGLFNRSFRGRRRRLDAREKRHDKDARANAGEEAGENFPLDLQGSSSSIASGFASA
jgi:hypothetical protein